MLPERYLPQSVQKRISIYLLQRALGQFLENELNVDNMDIQLGQGKVILKDIRLNLNVGRGHFKLLDLK
jgi:hypothetical protein